MNWQSNKHQKINSPFFQKTNFKKWPLNFLNKHCEKYFPCFFFIKDLGSHWKKGNLGGSSMMLRTLLRKPCSSHPSLDPSHLHGGTFKQDLSLGDLKRPCFLPPCNGWKWVFGPLTCQNQMFPSQGQIVWRLVSFPRSLKKESSSLDVWYPGIR